MSAWIRSVDGGCELLVKVVPGASRSGPAGLLGDRWKLRIAAPPEGGKANRALEELLVRLTGRPCQIVAGHGMPLKTVLVRGGDIAALERLATG